MWSATIQWDPETHKWNIDIENNKHNNHAPYKNLSEIPVARTPTPQQHTNILNLANGQAPPRLKVWTLKISDRFKLSTSQDVYNMIKEQNKIGLDRCTPLEYLLDNLKHNEFYHTYELDPDNRVLYFFCCA